MRSAAGPLDRCAICGAPDLEPIALREMLFGTRETFEYLHCPACGVLHIASVPDDLGRHYPPAYHPAGDVDGPRPLGPLARLADETRNGAILFGRRRLLARLLRPWRPPVLPEVQREAEFVRLTGLRSLDDPILDVGCGVVPARLVRLRRIGFRRLAGIDPWLDADSSYLGIPLHRQSIHDVAGAYQVIMFNHSFEHVPDPREALAAAASRLRPGGSIVIRTPVIGGWFWRTYGRDWWELDPPRHLFVHSRRSLERLAADAGLEVSAVVFDSTFVEIVASEQIRRDVAWREAGSWLVNPPAGFEAATLDGYRATVERLNASGDAGRAAFYLRAPGASRATRAAA